MSSGDHGGKHAGKRRAEPPPKAARPPRGEPGDEPSAPSRPTAKLLVLALGITLCVVAWGYLVYAAIDFGTSARGGETRGWWLLGLASLGAVACLFIGLMLVARLIRMLGVGKGSDQPPPPPRPVGGKRAAR